MPGSIAIIEDEVLIALDLSLMCEELGWQVVGTAHSAAQALERFPSLAPDVVLTDMQIGAGGDGADVAEELRQARPEVVVVVVTAATDTATLARVSAARPDCVLTKPVSPKALENALNRLHVQGVR